MRKLFAVCSLLLSLSCAGKTPEAQNRPPLTADQAQSFEDGVDFVATLEGIEGRWRDDWDKELDVRVGSADLIALVTIRTLRTDTDPEQRITHRLLAQVERELVGDADGEIELAVHADARGFTSVHENLGRLSDQQFVAYVRRGPEKLHWHLSPASEPVVSETESRISARRASSGGEGAQRVTVHQN
jgi:hypothetical protein